MNRVAQGPVGGGKLLDVPFFSQTTLLCGGAAVAMVERYWGDLDVHPQDFSSLVDVAAGGIRSDALVAAVRQRGAQAIEATGDDSDVAAQIARGRPVIALIEDHPKTFHFVVIVAWTNDHVIFHDPARSPFRVLNRAEFERAWAGTNRWSLVILPGTLRGSSAPISIVAPPRPAEFSACDALVHEGVALAGSGDLTQAEDRLVTATVMCPNSAGGWRELAGLRFVQSRWHDASTLAAHAVGVDAHDNHAWELLGASRYLDDDPDGALVAWNHLGQPMLDVITIHGADRTRQPVIANVLDLPPHTVITAAHWARARRRLADLPAVSSTRLSYRPLDNGQIDVDVSVVEPSEVPSGVVGLGALGVESLIQEEISVPVSDLTGSGDVWTMAFRWPSARRRVLFDLATPAPGPLPGIADVQGMWERQSYAIGNAGAGIVTRETLRHSSFGLSDWMTGRVRWRGSAALDQWDSHTHVGMDVGIDTRADKDRVAFGGDAGLWTAAADSPSFDRVSLKSAWRSTIDRTSTQWSALAGLTVASDAAPMSLWDGAGTGLERDPLLRAHPLMHDNVIDGQVFGRTLAHATMEYQRPIGRVAITHPRLAVFVDTARAWRRLSGGPSDLFVDVGAGLRIAAPGVGGVVRLDLATGLTDGHIALSAGWTAPWPW